MSKLNDFIASGARDLPVYITDVRRDFLASSGAELTLDLKKFDGAIRRIVLKLPVAEAQEDRQMRFLRDYFFAEVYNALSALGGVCLQIYTGSADRALVSLLEELPGAFGIGLPRKDRAGYGRSVNVIERMLGSQGIAEPFAIKVIYGQAPDIPKKAEVRADFAAAFSKAFAGVDGQVLCGVDIGGTDIKLAASVKGKLCYLKEYDWFPTLFVRSRQLIDPICLLVRLLRARVSCEMASVDAAVVAGLDRAVNEHLPDSEIEAATLAAERELGDKLVGFDRIGLCFPDVVIKNKIVGGEVFKTRGIRENPEIDYEAEFKKLTDLDDLLLKYCAPGGRVRMTNDGPMAAFTAALELIAAGGQAQLADGRFAHTLGTELGTGWIDETGKIPEIPLEVYNFIIDLGSFGARAYHPDDLRSINNFNTGLPGTLQKFMAQNGVFRLAIKLSLASGGKHYRELLEKGFIYEKAGGVFVTLEPKDMRKPLLEYLMDLCESKDPVIQEVFREIGRSAGITFCETEHLLAPRTKERVMYGRLVKKPHCFALLKEGASEIDKTLQISVADGQNAFTDLMLQLKAHPVYTVAQFAQAVGALYYGNL